MRQILLIFFSALLFCLFFIHTPASLPTSSSFEPGQEMGRVLGASETTVRHSLSELYRHLGLPVSQAVSQAITQAQPPQRRLDVQPLELPACRGFLLDINSDQVLFDQEADTPVPIASITKLVTALTFLDHNPGWDKECVITLSDVTDHGRQYVYPGEKIYLKDLFYLSLVGSANTATRALARASGLALDEFVAGMNAKAKEWGLEQTHFVDPAGLGMGNVSTAREIARIARIAFDKPEIGNATIHSDYYFQTVDGQDKRVQSTNTLLRDTSLGQVAIQGGKTGYTEFAGYCFVGQFADAAGHDVISVVLGSSDQNSRFRLTKDLLRWGFANYVWP